MGVKFFNQLEFSSLLFDTIFGLILFYSFDSLIAIGQPLTLVLYLFSMLIVVHWWLLFKSTDDSFAEEVTDSAADIVFGILYAIVLYYLVQYSRSSNIAAEVWCLVGVLALDFTWSSIWRYVGQWRTKDAHCIARMEQILERNIALDVGFGLIFTVLGIMASHFSSNWISGLYVGLYSLFIAGTFICKTLDIDIF